MADIVPNWHPAAVHFPIALGMRTVLLLVAARMSPAHAGLSAAARLLLPLAAISAVIPAALGWNAFGTVEYDAAGHRAGDPALDGKLPVAVAELPPPANCLDEGLGRVVAPRDPDTRMRVHAVDAALAEAHAERMLGDYFAAVEHARRAVVAADASGHRPALARAHLVLGKLERLRGRGEASAAALEAASAEAGLAQDLALQVRAEHELVRLALLAGHLPESADGHLQHAAATLAALPADEQGGLPLTRLNNGFPQVSMVCRHVS